jgi:hypothetical protein
MIEIFPGNVIVLDLGECREIRVLISLPLRADPVFVAEGPDDVGAFVESQVLEARFLLTLAILARRDDDELSFRIGASSRTFAIRNDKAQVDVNARELLVSGDLERTQIRVPKMRRVRRHAIWSSAFCGLAPGDLVIRGGNLEHCRTIFARVAGTIGDP